MAQSLSNLPIGAKLKFGKYSVNGETAQPIIWLIVAKNHSGYPSNAVTLLSEKVIDVRPFDAYEYGLPDGKNGGNNNYSVSNIDQWLNKSTSPWYEAAHEKDTPPEPSDYMSEGSAYVNRPGFLNAFTEQERNKILSTTILVRTYGIGLTSIVRKIFLPSWKELSGNATYGDEGAIWEYFVTGSRAAKYTSQFVTNNRIGASYDTYMDASYYLRTTENNNANYVSAAYGTQSMSRHFASAVVGIRPALNLSTTDMVSDTTDSDGCYTIIPNTAPPVPTTLNVPSAIYGGKSTTISWSGVTDPDGQAVTYQLEQSIAGGAFTTIYSGTNLSYTTTVAFGSASVQFRLKAIDTMSASSGYITSTSRTVINNTAPTISGSDGSLGTKDNEFTHSYTVRDVDGYPVTVTESIDGVQVRSYVATQDAGHTFSVTGNTWAALANGSHTLTIRATDGVDSSTRTFTFVKSVSSFTVQNSAPYVASTMPVRIKVNISGNIPIGATKKIEVCNNGFDASPTWEDASTAESGGLIHVFTNKTKTATQWGVKIRVTVNRNGASGACYITSIGGNFE